MKTPSDRSAYREDRLAVAQHYLAVASAFAAEYGQLSDEQAAAIRAELVDALDNALDAAIQRSLETADRVAEPTTARETRDLHGP